jgi:hypothetical protein
MIVLYTWRGETWQKATVIEPAYPTVVLERVEVLAGRQITAADEPEMPTFRPTGEFVVRSKYGLRRWRP